MLKVRVRTPIRPTEDPERVAAAIRNLFPDATVETKGDHAVAEAGNLEPLADLIDALRIPDTARAVMLRGVDASGEQTRFLLGKQAAFMGKPHFAPPPSPLGDLEVTVEADSPLALETLIYETAHDTTVPLEWARVPPSLRGEGGRAEARNAND